MSVTVTTTRISRVYLGRKTKDDLIDLVLWITDGKRDRQLLAEFINYVNPRAGVPDIMADNDLIEKFMQEREKRIQEEERAG